MYARLITASSLLVLVACASQPEKIQAVSVSDYAYKDYSCEMIAHDLDRVEARAAELQGSLQDEADADSAQMAVGLVLFWPALFFLEGGDGPEAQEYARIKGERMGLQKEAVRKECDIDFAPAIVVQETTSADCLKAGRPQGAANNTAEVDWNKVRKCEAARAASAAP